ncbi:MAG: VOC family protein [Patescibacteria group bacterium]
MQKITPFLWFDTEAEEAANFYVDLFNGNPAKSMDSKILNISRYPEEGEEVTGKPAGSVMVAEFELEGTCFTALNGGPHFKLNGAVSFVIDCKTQEEVDYFWDKLSTGGGEAGQCGWINHDKFGATWQIVPDVLGKLLSDPDKDKSARAMAAMLKMTKLDIAALEKAHRGE